MKIKPNESFKLLGTDIELDKNKTYEAEVASNIPNHKERGLVFVEGLLLDKYEYAVVGRANGGDKYDN